jgi:hypothetical protein
MGGCHDHRFQLYALRHIARNAYTRKVARASAIVGVRDR